MEGLRLMNIVYGRDRRPAFGTAHTAFGEESWDPMAPDCLKEHRGSKHLAFLSPLTAGPKGSEANRAACNQPCRLCMGGEASKFSLQMRQGPGVQLAAGKGSLIGYK